MKKKVLSLLAVLAVLFGLPLCAQPQLLLNPRMLAMMLATTLVWLTQPVITPEDAAENQASDRNSVWIILFCSALSLVAPMIEWAYFSRESSCDNAGIWPATGLILMIGGLALRLWAIRTLGAFFTSTVQVQERQRVISSGPYAWVRHPSYLGAYLAFLGGALLLEAWTGLVIAMAGMFLAYWYRIVTEERTLVAKMGAEYEQYMARSAKLIPFLW